MHIPMENNAIQSIGKCNIIIKVEWSKENQ